MIRRYTKREIVDTKAELKREAEEKLQETERAKEDGERAIKVFEAQEDPTLQETAEALDVQGDELKREIKNEVDEKAREVERTCREIEDTEEKIKTLESIEREAIDTLARGKTMVESSATRKILDNIEKTRKETAEFYQETREELEKKREDVKREVYQEMKGLEKVLADMKKFAR